MSLDARFVAAALGGDAHGKNVVAPGPGHSRRDRSMSVTLDSAAPDGFLVNSFAGNSPASCRDHVRRALRGADLSAGGSMSAPDIRANAEQMFQAARRIWIDALPISGTLVESYLRARGIEIAAPAALRFHSTLRHPTGTWWPGMVAEVTDMRTGSFKGVHRTFLALDGAAKAPVEPQKMMLGPCRGGAVRLGSVANRVLISEGIETALSVMQASGLPTLAALSTSGLRSLELPEVVRDIVIVADGDRAGEKAAVVAARRWKNEGRTARIARPPWGMDFNDMLMASAVTHSAPAEDRT